MCRAVNCQVCGRTTWAGCGRHVESVMAGVPASRRCPGPETPATTPSPPLGFMTRLPGRRRP